MNKLSVDSICLKDDWVDVFQVVPELSNIYSDADVILEPCL